MNGEGAVLVGRLPPARRTPTYEPVIVTTLRRYVRRGASVGLVRRLAGGERDWRLLNDWWNIDGTVSGRKAPLGEASSPQLGDRILSLSAYERRIALAQLADDYAEARCAFPSASQLGRYFGVSTNQITHDLGVLRTEGRISPSLRTNEAAA